MKRTKLIAAVLSAALVFTNANVYASELNTSYKEETVEANLTDEATADTSDVDKNKAISILEGFWEGHYFASQGKTALNLKISSVSENGNVVAVFNFSEHPDNPGVPTGCYTMKGTYDFSNDHLHLDGEDWLEHPSGYVFVDIQANVDLSSASLTGTTSGYEGLTLTRIGDLNDPAEGKAAYYKEMGAKGYGSVIDTMTVSKNGRKYVATPNPKITNNRLTIAKGNKIVFNANFDKKSIKYDKLKPIVKVSNSGVLTAKAAGTATIHYSVNGVPKKLVVVVINPTISTSTNSILVKKMKGTTSVGQTFDIDLDAPLTVVPGTIKNKDVVSNLSFDMADDGHYHVTGTASKKGSAKIPFTINGKKFNITVKVTK